MNIQMGSNGFGANMPQSKAKSVSFGLAPLLAMIFIGIAMIIGGVFFITSSKIDPSWTRVEGSVIDFREETTRRSRTDSGGSRDYDDDRTYYPVVEYNVDGQKYTVKSSLGSSTQPRLGESRTVAYEPTHPQSAKLVDSAGMQVLLYLIPAAGVLVIIAAIIGYSSSKKRAGTVKTLQQSGYKTTGVIVDIQSQHHGAGANDSGYKIVVSATNGSGIVNNYVSDELYSIGGLAMIDFRTNPVPIDVYIDTVNPENYYVDVDDIPNLTPDRIADMIKTVVKPAEYTSINVNSQNPAQPNSVSVPLPQQPQAFNQPNTAPIVSQEQQAPQNDTTQYNDRT
jgi:hypothetical protein